MSYTVTIGTENNISVSLSQVGQQGIQGDQGLFWQGVWTLSSSYVVDDAVSNNGSSYICIQAHTATSNDEPGVGAGQAAYWEILAAKGLDGDGVGTVTSVGTGAGLTGGPITSTGTVALDAASIASLALADTATQPGDLATVATSGAYADLSGTPTLATVATSGAYSDLTGTPDLSNVVQSDVTGITGADAITNIVSLTQAEYDAIGTPDAATLYVVTA